MTSVQGAYASIRLAKVGTKKGHEKAPHPVTGEGRVWISKQLSNSNRCYPATRFALSEALWSSALLAYFSSAVVTLHQCFTGL